MHPTEQYSLTRAPLHSTHTMLSPRTRTIAEGELVLGRSGLQHSWRERVTRGRSVECWGPTQALSRGNGREGECKAHYHQSQRSAWRNRGHHSKLWLLQPTKTQHSDSGQAAEDPASASRRKTGPELWAGCEPLRHSASGLSPQHTPQSRMIGVQYCTFRQRLQLGTCTHLHKHEPWAVWVSSHSLRLLA